MAEGGEVGEKENCCCSSYMQTKSWSYVCQYTLSKLRHAYECVGMCCSRL